MRTCFICILLAVASFVTVAGNNTDSLLTALKTVKGNQRVDILNKLIKQIYRKDIKQARQYLAEAEGLSSDYEKGKAGVLINKGRITFFETKDNEKAIEIYKQALEIAEKNNFIAELEIAYSYIGNCYFGIGKMNEAQAIFDRALKKAEELKSIRIKAQIHGDLGVMEFYKGDLEAAKPFFKQSIAEYEQINDKVEVAGTTMNLGIIYYRTGKNAESLVHYEKALAIMREIKDSTNIANAITNIAITKGSMGKEQEAIASYFEAEKVYKAQRNILGLADCYENISSSYRSLGKNDLAAKYVIEGLRLREKEKDERGLTYSYINLGDIMLAMHDTTKGMEYYTKAMALAKKLNDEYRYAHILVDIAVVHTDHGRFTEAEKLIRQAIEISKRVNDPHGLSSWYLSLGNNYKKQNDLDNALKYYLESLKLKEQLDDKEGMAGLLNNIGVICYDKKQFRESIKYYERALKLRTEIKNTQGVADSYLSLSNAYREVEDFRNAYHYAVKYHATWDSTYNSNITAQIAEMNTKYETAKKDKEILERTAGEKEAKVLAEKKAIESKNANQRFIFLAIGFVLVLVLAGFTYRANLQRKKANESLAQANDLLAASNDEIMSQKFEITMQKHLVEEKQKEIIDSISYAKRLQEAILPPISSFKKYLPEGFVLYQPKDIVAGDFYWMEPLKDKIFLAAADCTGHGVPGAMVSVVCSNALNRAVHEFEITEPGKILDKVRELVVETFGKSVSDVKDGMDISLVRLDKNNIGGCELKWAGANNPLWYYRDGEMKKIAPNKQPIGKTDNPEPFTTHTVQLKQGEIFYLFTDGFADQFGGPKGKKYKTKKLEELFRETISEDMNVQEQKILSEFNAWKGNLEQIDDVCVIGIRV